MAIKAGAYVTRALLNSNCTEWEFDLFITATGGNSNSNVEFYSSSSRTEAQHKAAIAEFVKDYIDTEWSISCGLLDVIYVVGVDIYAHIL